MRVSSLCLLCLPLMGPWVQQPEKAPKPSAQAAADQAREEAEYFQLCDLNGNGWISFREAEVTLGMSKEAFRHHDTSGDGRIRIGEFRPRYREMLQRLGQVRPREVDPNVLEDRYKLSSTTPTGNAFERTPLELLRLYDQDGSRGLDHNELLRLCSGLDVTLSPRLVLGQADRDGSGELETGELVALAALASRRLADDSGSRSDSSGLMRDPVTGELTSPRLQSPLSHFQRLDLAGDGFVDEREVAELISPARLGVRPATVIAALDTDGDGRLSRREFEAGLGAR